MAKKEVDIKEIRRRLDAIKPRFKHDLSSNRRYTEADTEEANFEDWLYDCPVSEKDCTDEWVEKDKMGNDVKVVCYYFKIPMESEND